MNGIFVVFSIKKKIFMGYYKEKEIEDFSRGYSLPDENKCLCARHYKDVYLRRYVKKHSHKGVCSYCNKKTGVIPLSDFVEYTMDRIRQYYTTPDEDGLYLEKTFYDDDEIIPGLKRVNGYVTRENAKTFDSVEELLEEIDLISDNEALDQDIQNCFLQEEWIQKDSVSRTVDEELSDLWEEFTSLVIHQRRFTFYMLPQFDETYHSEENGLQGILTEISKSISDLGLYNTLQCKTTLYRCRYIDSKSEVKAFENLTSPPNKNASENRMNPMGVSMFYGAFDRDTAKEEARNSAKKFCAIGEFNTKQKLTILDLTQLPEESFWANHWQELSFLQSFSRKISKSIDEKSKYSYVPTQIFAEYIRYCCRHKGKKIDGIIYKSSKGVMSKNIVLFYDQKDSANVLELKNFEIQEILTCY